MQPQSEDAVKKVKNKMRPIFVWLYENPWARSIGSVLNTLIGGLIASWLFEATKILVVPENGDDFSEFSLDDLSYWLIFSTIIYVVYFIFYHRILYITSKNILLWNDESYRTAKIIADTWDEFVSATKKNIRDGKIKTLDQIASSVVLP